MSILYKDQKSSTTPAFGPAPLNIRIVTLYGLVVAVTCFSLGRTHAQAIDSDQDHYSYGLNPASEEQLRGILVTPTYRDFLPAKKDLANLFPTVGDQGRQNSCVGWAVGYAARAYYAHYAEDRDVSLPENIPSPAYIYNLIKQPGACDTGSTIPGALNLLKSGAPSLKQFPYRQSVCMPPADLRSTDFRIDSWSRVNFKIVDQVKAALYRGDPVVVGFHVSSAFEHLKAGQIYRNPDRYLGWHAITVVGYDDTRQAFKLINSWGSAWADHGYGWVDYQAIPAEVQEAYVMHVTAPTPQPIPAPVAVVPPLPPQSKPAPAPTPANVVPAPLPAPAPKPAPAPVEVGPSPPTPQPKPGPAPTPAEVVPPQPRPQPVPIVLPQLECAEVRVIGADHGQTITGFIGHDEDLERLRAAAQGATIDVKVRPFPQCEALITLDKPLGRPASELPKVKIQQPANNILTEGEDLVFEIETPPYPSYLHVAYFQADGTGYQRVVNLIQPGVGSFTAYPPRTKLVIGNDPGARRFKVSAPFGREMLIVLAGRSPIFTDRRPDQETEREFLSALSRALLWKADPSASDRDIVAAYDTTITMQRRAQ